MTYAKRFYSIICIFIGAILLHPAISTGHQYWETLRTSLASTLFSVGAIGIILEFFLRRELQLQLLSLVGIERSVAASSVIGVGKVANFDWEAFCRTGTDFRIVDAGAEDWATKYWPYLKARFSRVTGSLTIYLPDPEGEYLHHLSNHRQEDVDELRRRAESVAKSVERLWNEAQGEKSMKKGTRLTIWYLHSFASYGVFSNDVETAIILESPIRRSGQDYPFYIHFKASPDVEPLPVFVAALRNTDVARPQFEKVMK